MKELDPDTAHGPDGISPSVLTDCAEPLTNHFHEGSVPTEWKRIYDVMPKYKKKM